MAHKRRPTIDVGYIPESENDPEHRSTPTPTTPINSKRFCRQLSEKNCCKSFFFSENGEKVSHAHWNGSLHAKTHALHGIASISVTT